MVLVHVVGGEDAVLLNDISDYLLRAFEVYDVNAAGRVDAELAFRYVHYDAEPFSVACVSVDRAVG